MNRHLHALRWDEREGGRRRRRLDGEARGCRLFARAKRSDGRRRRPTRDLSAALRVRAHLRLDRAVALDLDDAADGIARDVRALVDVHAHADAGRRGDGPRRARSSRYRSSSRPTTRRARARVGTSGVGGAADGVEGVAGTSGDAATISDIASGARVRRRARVRRVASQRTDVYSCRRDVRHQRRWRHVSDCLQDVSLRGQEQPAAGDVAASRASSAPRVAAVRSMLNARRPRAVDPPCLTQVAPGPRSAPQIVEFVHSFNSFFRPSTHERRAVELRLAVVLRDVPPPSRPRSPRATAATTRRRRPCRSSATYPRTWGSRSPFP